MTMSITTTVGRSDRAFGQFHGLPARGRFSVWFRLRL